MGKKKETGPTAQSIQALLRELSGLTPSMYSVSKKPEYIELNRQIDAFEAKLLNNALLKKMKNKLKKMEDDHQAAAEQMSRDVRECRLLFLAKGLCPAVINRAEWLVSKYKDVVKH